MIDTLKFLVPIADPDVLVRLEKNMERVRKENLKTGEVKFEYHSANIKLGSYERSVNLKSTIVPSGLFVECSLPKYYRGTNVEMIYPHELPTIVQALYTELCLFVDDILPSWETWQVYRLDICYNWTLPTPEAALQAIDFIKRIDYPRKKRHVWDTSVMYQGSAYVVKFYVKGPEFKRHDYKETVAKDPQRADTLHKWADCILRFEVGLKHQYLMQHLKKKVITVSDIAADALIESLLQHYLGIVFRYINTEHMTNEAVDQRLQATCTPSMALKLYQFYKGYYYDDDMRSKIIRGMNRSTIYRYKKTLQRLGIGFAVTEVDTGVLKLLTIPSPCAHFALPITNDTMPV